MRTVISIEYKEKKISKEGKPYTISHVMVDDGTVCEFYGDEIRVGDEVMVAHDKAWDKIKAILPKNIDI